GAGHRDDAAGRSRRRGGSAARARRGTYGVRRPRSAGRAKDRHAPRDGGAVRTERLIERLRRVEQQIRAFKELHASELQLILDELTDITNEVVSESQPEATEAPAESAVDPAAGSPKRAKGLADQARKSRPLSRRELLRGRDEGS